MNTTIKDENLVKWILTQGADPLVSYRFVLEKGIGESIGVEVLDHETVALTWYLPNEST